MTENSYICRFIRDNPETWRDELDMKKIRVKTDGDLSIFNYMVNADFSDPIVQEARGIIINRKTLDVVCWAFRKFGNYTESYADKIDWSTARVQEKVDGSLVKLFYNSILQKWQWATMSVIDAKDATVMNSDKTFFQLITEADNFAKIMQCEFDQRYTYMFELVSPETQIVIKYPRTHLYHLGTRSNITGEETEKKLHWIKRYSVNGKGYTSRCVIDYPLEYKINSLDDCVAAAKELNKDDVCLHEGFVVVDANWHRVKIKSPEYLMLHRMAGNGNLTKERMVSMYRAGRDLAKYMEDFPNFTLPLSYYIYQCKNFEYLAEQMVSYTRNLYEELNHERGAVAKMIKNNKYSHIGFRALDVDGKAADILAEMSDTQYAKFIPDFNWPKISY